MRRYEVLLPSALNDGHSIAETCLRCVPETLMEVVDQFGALSFDRGGIDGVWISMGRRIRRHAVPSDHRRARHRRHPAVDDQVQRGAPRALRPGRDPHGVASHRRAVTSRSPSFRRRPTMHCRDSDLGAPPPEMRRLCSRPATSRRGLTSPASSSEPSRRSTSSTPSRPAPRPEHVRRTTGQPPSRLATRNAAGASV